MSQSSEPEQKNGKKPPAPHIAPVKGTEVGSVFVSNYPPFSFWQPDDLASFEKSLDTPWDRDALEVPLGLYLHIPFCRKRCKFCYFRVYTDKNSEQIQTYLDALAREVDLYAQRAAVTGRPLRFVYFGGGTPSYIAVKHLRTLVDRIQGSLPWDNTKEVTFECEPGTLTESKLEAIRGIGVTRLSLGVEHFDDDILEDNGRAHVSKEIYRCLPWIKAQGFDQLNVDLIAGMVGETWETWRLAVEKTIELDPDSVTIYQMELPFNTRYSQGILAGGESPVAEWSIKREWNDYAIETLGAAGYDVSSAYTMVKRRGDGHSDDQRSPDYGKFLYRDALWRGSDLLGTGVAAFGHLGGVHVQNVADWHGYLDPIADGRMPLGRAYATSDAERLTRELILQMKLGVVDTRPFAKKFGVDVLEQFHGALDTLRQQEMLEVDGPRIRLTRQGLLQVDRLLPSFYDDKHRNARYT